MRTKEEILETLFRDGNGSIYTVAKPLAALVEIMCDIRDLIAKEE